MSFNAKGIPSGLKDKRQWVAYSTYKKDGRTIKVMIDPKTGLMAKSNDPRTWSSFIDARMFMKDRKMEGLAFVLTSGITFIDIDHTRNSDGSLSEFAKKVLKEIPNTYAEYSVSGEGVHIFGFGSIGCEAMKRNDTLGLEMYDTKRFCCMTGNVIDNRTKLLDISEVVKEFNAKYMPRNVRVIPERVANFDLNLDEETIIKKIRESKSKEKFDKLFEGDYSDYPSQSNADFALCRIISFWTRNPNIIDNIVRQSGLYRDKWDRKQSGKTYGEITIENAIGVLAEECEME